MNTRWRALWPGLLGVTLAACSGSEGEDTGSGPRPDAGLDAGGDAGVQDGSTADAGTPDGGGLDGGLPDAGGATVTAVVGQRCDFRERVGLLKVTTWSVDDRFLDLSWDDRPAPWWADPELSDDACLFHRFSTPPSCGSCDPTQVCDALGRCVDPPVPVPGITVEVQGANTETFTGDGVASGVINLTDPSLGIRVRAGAVVITLERPLPIPAELPALTDELTGTSDRPAGLDVTWTPIASEGRAYTLVPINHHDGSPTFTECQVPTSAGRLHIDGPMLQPLAVITGLEFQGMEHAIFAAAQLPSGCFEIRFTRRFPPGL